MLLGSRLPHSGRAQVQPDAAALFDGKPVYYDGKPVDRSSLPPEVLGLLNNLVEAQRAVQEADAGHVRRAAKAIQDGTFTPPKGATPLGKDWIPIGSSTPAVNNGGVPGPSRMGGAAASLPDEVQELMARALDGLAAHQRAQGGDPNEVRLEIGGLPFDAATLAELSGRPRAATGSSSDDDDLERYPAEGGTAAHGGRRAGGSRGVGGVPPQPAAHSSSPPPGPPPPASPKPLIRPPRRKDGLTPPPKDWVAPPPASRSGTGGDRRPPSPPLGRPSDDGPSAFPPPPAPTSSRASSGDSSDSDLPPPQPPPQPPSPPPLPPPSALPRSTAPASGAGGDGVESSGGGGGSASRPPGAPGSGGKKARPPRDAFSKTKTADERSRVASAKANDAAVTDGPRNGPARGVGGVGGVGGGGGGSGNGASVLLFVGQMTAAPVALSAHTLTTADTALVLNLQLAQALTEANYRVTMAGHLVPGSYHGITLLDDASLKMLVSNQWCDGELGQISQWEGRSCATRPRYDHVIISQHLAQFVMRHPIVSNRGSYLWLHDTYPSGLLWAQQPPPPQQHATDDDSAAAAAHVSSSQPVAITNHSSAHVAATQMPTHNTHEADARPPAIALMATALPLLSAVLCRSHWHAEQVADMLVTAGFSFASSSKKVVVVPMAYDYGEWDRGRQRLAAESAMGQSAANHGANANGYGRALQGSALDPAMPVASKKVRHRFLFCVLPQPAKLQHGLRTVLAVFPVLRKQISGATLVVVSTQRVPLPPDLKRELEAPWVTYRGVIDRAALIEEALRSEVFIYLPSANEAHHNLALEMMISDQLIVAQRFASVQFVLDDERGVFLEHDGEGRLVFDMPLLRTLMTERPDLRSEITTRARNWAEAQSWGAAVRSWERLFALGGVGIHETLGTLGGVEVPEHDDDRFRVGGGGGGGGSGGGGGGGSGGGGHGEGDGGSGGGGLDAISAGLHMLFGWLLGSTWLLVVVARGSGPPVWQRLPPEEEQLPPPQTAVSSPVPANGGQAHGSKRATSKK